MSPEERIASWTPHDSQRGIFAYELYKAMARDERIWCLTGDLGYGCLDNIKEDFPTRFVNVGASEQLLIGAGVGLALEGKIPFCYSITTFLLFRPFEWIRNYLNHECIPVRLVGSGLENDYKRDGMSHQPWGIYDLIDKNLPNVRQYYPTYKEGVPKSVQQMIVCPEPSFLCLRR